MIYEVEEHNKNCSLVKYVIGNAKFLSFMWWELLFKRNARQYYLRKNLF